MDYQVFIPYLLVMALVTYLIRVIPLVMIKKKITNRFFRSFLYYVPYVTLAVMTFPAIMGATESQWSALAALIIGIVLAFLGNDLMVVSIACVLTVFLTELLIF